MYADIFMVFIQVHSSHVFEGFADCGRKEHGLHFFRQIPHNLVNRVFKAHI